MFSPVNLSPLPLKETGFFAKLSAIASIGSTQSNKFAPLNPVEIEGRREKNGRALVIAGFEPAAPTKQG